MLEPGTPVADDGTYVLFVDLKKAFDSVPRPVIWKTLRACGTPENLVALVADFHDGMGSRIKHRGLLSDRFGLESGVRQGAVEAPTLWDLYYHFVIEDWRRRLTEELGREPGVMVASVADLRLDRPRQKTRLSAAQKCTRISELAYADDLATIHSSFEELVLAAEILDQTVRDWLLVRPTSGLHLGHRAISSAPG